MSAQPLQTKGLKVGYPVRRGAAKVVAEDLNLELASGEFVCLLGPNGVGKSTLIRTLAGMQPSLDGRISVAGTDIGSLSPLQRARQLAVVLTDSLPTGLFDGFSVVALGRHPYTGWMGGLTERDRERIAWALEAAGATALAHRQVSELSDGERQKIMIARALAQETRVMLLDEPTAFLDLPRRVELMRTLRELARREGLSILLSTHDLDLALRSADRLWLLGAEGTLRSGMPEELALEGRIAATFASAEVDWDSEQGSFRMHRQACATAFVEGEGPPSVWTRRALTRIGYEVMASAADSNLKIQAEGGCWLVTAPDAHFVCRSLGELVEALLAQGNSED